MTGDRVPPSESLPLSRNVSFLGMTVAQFLGAFNDNLFKYVVLLQCADRVLRGEQDRQSVAQILFALPFLAFSGFAGFLSDRFAKRTIVVSCKFAEVVIMALGTVAVVQDWLPASLLIVFLMGTHSAFFGPSKFGILPEIVPVSQLPKANGVFLMTTFLGIILGMVAGGILKSLMPTAPWVSGLALMGVAIVGTVSASLVRHVPAVVPGPAFDTGSLIVSRETRELIRRDRALCLALVVSSLFWFCGGVVQSSVTALGKQHLFLYMDKGTADLRTSLLAASLAIGIAVGCATAGVVSRGRADFRLTIGGAWGLIGCLIALAILGGTTPPGPDMEIPTLVLLVLVGASAGFFTVPLQVFIQSRPPAWQKGRVLGAMNFIQWIGIFAAGVFYDVGTRLNTALHLPVATLFATTALVIVPVGVFYRPWKVSMPERLEADASERNSP